MSADQTPAADPTPGSSRVDVAGLRAAAETFASRTSSRGGPPEVEAAVESVKRRLSWPSMHWGAEDLHPDALPHIAAAALDGAGVHDLAARLATAEAEVERQQRIVMGILNERDLLVRSLKLERRRAEAAERQVQAGLAVLDGHDHADTCGAVLSPGAKYPCSCWKADVDAALAALDPDAPTGHDGHGDPETHQGDTEAGDGR